jgi:hypothetical protein
VINPLKLRNAPMNPADEMAEKIEPAQSADGVAGSDDV